MPHQICRARYGLSSRLFCFGRERSKHIVDRLNSSMGEASELSRDSKERLHLLSRRRGARSLRQVGAAAAAAVAAAASSR